MPFFLKNTIFVAGKILTTTDRHLLERAIFIGSCLLHLGDGLCITPIGCWRTGHGGHRPTFFLQKVVTICVSLKKK